MVNFILADRHTWSQRNRTVDGHAVEHVATQQSQRTARKKKTIYVYHIVGQNKIIFNRNSNSPMYMPIANDEKSMSRYMDIFVRPPLTEQERAWLSRYGYELVA